jgi:hypothetical protein
MTKQRQGKALVKRIEAMLKQMAGLPALQDELLKEREIARVTMGKVIVAYDKTAEQVRWFIEKTQAVTKMTDQYLTEYHATNAPHPTPAKQATHARKEGRA